MNSISHRKIAAHYALSPRCGPIPRPVLTFDAGGRLLSVERDVAPAEVDGRAGVEFFSGLLVPAIPGAAFDVGTSPGVAVIDRVDWETLEALPEARVRRIL